MEDEEEGLWGFTATDLWKEVRRANRLVTYAFVIASVLSKYDEM